MFVHEIVKRGKADSIAIVDHGRRISYRELTEAIHICRDRMYAIGVRLGDRVGLFSRNRAEYVFIQLAAASLGAIAVPINFQLSRREIAYIVKDSGIRHLFTDKEIDLADSLHTLNCTTEIIYHRIDEWPGEDTGLPEAPFLPMDFTEDDPCIIIYTSGTTGSPKGAVLSHKNLVSNVEQLHWMYCRPEHIVLCVLPMYHCFGWTCSVLYPLYSGASMVILDSFTPKETIETIRTEKVTDMYVVPSICSLLTKLATAEDMATLRLVVSGGTTLPLKVENEFITKFGVSICECYGLSEASPIVTINPVGKEKIGSIGPIVPQIEWRLIDNAGRDVPQGESGELIVKGPNVMLGYWNLPEATADALKNGWLYTGDIARADEDGYIFISGRIKDMIISMGENIYPREVEEIIYQFPGIKEAAVVGVEDKLRGQAGACFYSVHEGAEINLSQLKKFLQQNLALYKIPREFHLVQALPRTSTGKIAKRLILEQLENDRED